MTPDSELLRRYADDHDQAAFRDWVERRINLVYSVALRLLNGDSHGAEDVTQQVFTDAARRAASLAGHPALSAWLFTSTRFAAAKTVRTHQRRRQREHSAAMDLPPSEPDVDWDTVRPVIDDALATLPDADRDAILLRYFEQADYAAIGERLDLSANAARMRVDRALDKLSAQLQRRGIRSTATALGTALVGNALTAAPAGLATTISATALTTGALTTTATVLAMLKAPLIATAVVIATGTALISQESRQPETLHPSPAAVIAEVPKSPPPTTTPPPTVSDADYAALEHEVTSLQSRLAELDRVAVARLQKPRLEGKIYNVKELDALPKPRKQVPPTYPQEMRLNGITGKAVVAMTIDETGAVRDLETVSTTEVVFAEAALDAVFQWEFEPGQFAGAPVNTRLQVPIVFNISDSKEPTPIDDWF